MEPSTSISKVPSRVYLITQENPLLVYLTNEGISSVWRGSQLENSNENALGMQWRFLTVPSGRFTTAYSHSFDPRERVNSSSVSSSSSSSSNPRISYKFHWLFLLPVPFCPIPSHPLLWFVREISDDVMIKKKCAIYSYLYRLWWDSDFSLLISTDLCFPLYFTTSTMLLWCHFPLFNAMQKAGTLMHYSLFVALLKNLKHLFRLLLQWRYILQPMGTRNDENMSWLKLDYGTWISEGKARESSREAVL